ncbi:hypothetical protein B0H13DRAFT_2389312 [Mycena leptocephala]|nr:hypothetical protein B0H13DRAFT_2389312 [Mycena leptocephala]
MRDSTDRARAAHPGRPAGAADDGLPFDEHDTTRHVQYTSRVSLYRCMGERPRYWQLAIHTSFRLALAYNFALTLPAVPLPRTRPRARHLSRAADLDRNAGHAEAPTTCSDATPKAAIDSHCTRRTVGCRDDT